MKFQIRKYLPSILFFIVFEAIAITLWLTKNNLVYLFNFSYIVCSISLGLLLFAHNYKHARRIVQLLVGCYMLFYLGLCCNENMQIKLIYRRIWSGYNSLCSSQNFWTVTVWTWMVWLCLLDSNGSWFSPIRNTKP